MKKICVLILILLSGFAFTGTGNSKNKKKKKKDVTHVIKKTIIKSYDFYTEPKKIKPGDDELIDKLPAEIWYIIFANVGEKEPLLVVNKYTRHFCLRGFYSLKIKDVELLPNEKLKELILKYPNIIGLIIKQALFVRDKCEELVEEYPNFDKFGLPIYNNSVCLEFLSDIKNLQVLSLGCTYYLGDNDLKQLSNIKSLNSLTLSGSNIFELRSQITDKGLGYLSDIKNLKSLSFCYQYISGHGFQKLGVLTNLEKLSLMGEEITHENFKNTAKLTNLKSLSFYCCEITDENFMHISKLTNLQYLKIGEIENITDKGIGYLSSLTNLCHLTLAKLTRRVTEAGLDQLNHLSNLKDIEAINCDNYLVWEDNAFKTKSLKSRKKEKQIQN